MMVKVFACLVILLSVQIARSTRHVCGGNSELQVIKELFSNNPHIEGGEKLDHVLNICKEKAESIEKYTSRLIRKYEVLTFNLVRQRQSRIFVNDQLIVSAQAPDCMNFLNTEQLLNPAGTETGEILRQQYNSLLEIISVLQAMEYEESNNSEDDLFSRNFRNIWRESEQLLCELYVGLDISSFPLPDRTITGSVPLCIYTERLDRYERDYFLLHKIKVISKIFQRQYNEM